MSTVCDFCFKTFSSTTRRRLHSSFCDKNPRKKAADTSQLKILDSTNITLSDRQVVEKALQRAIRSGKLQENDIAEVSLTPFLESEIVKNKPNAIGKTETNNAGDKDVMADDLKTENSKSRIVNNQRSKKKKNKTKGSSMVSDFSVKVNNKIDDAIEEMGSSLVHGQAYYDVTEVSNTDFDVEVVGDGNKIAEELESLRKAYLDFEDAKIKAQSYSLRKAGIDLNAGFDVKTLENIGYGDVAGYNKTDDAIEDDATEEPEYYSLLKILNRRVHDHSNVNDARLMRVALQCFTLMRCGHGMCGDVCASATH